MTHLALQTSKTYPRVSLTPFWCQVVIVLCVPDKQAMVCWRSGIFSKMLLSGWISSPATCQLPRARRPWSSGAGGGFGEAGPGSHPEWWFESHYEPHFQSQKPEGRRGRLGLYGRRRGMEAGTRQSGNCSEVRLTTPGTERTGVLNGWTLCRGVLGPGFVSAERYVLPKCWWPGHSGYVSSGPYLVWG